MDIRSSAVKGQAFVLDGKGLVRLRTVEVVGGGILLLARTDELLRVCGIRVVMG